MNSKRFKNWKFPIIQHAIPTEYGWVCYYPEKFNLSKYTDIGWGCFLNARYGIEIGKDVQIGPYCSILSDNTINGQKGKIIIEDGAMIGSYSLVLPNVIICSGEFMRSRSIVYINKYGDRIIK